MSAPDDAADLVEPVADAAKNKLTSADWRRITGLVLLLLGALGGFSYTLFSKVVDSTYATREYVDTAMDKTSDRFAALPNRVGNLEIWQVEQKAAQQQDERQFSRIQQELAAIKATQVESAKANDRNFDRILNKLDTLK
jgi:predicted PurR-regulated permease PerM